MPFTFIDDSHNTNLGVVQPRSMSRVGVVIHETIGEHSLAWLQGGSLPTGKPVSADFLIDRDGDVHQITPLGYFAWHSGVARYNGYYERDGSINQGFYGIELENNPDAGEKVTDAQYIALAALLRVLMARAGINTRMVAGHYAVAYPSGRKTDPITLNWAILWREYLAPSPQAALLHFPEVLP